jgi:hypothetical protein
MGTEGRMGITLHLTPEQEAKLRSVVTQLRVSPEAWRRRRCETSWRCPTTHS